MKLVFEKPYTERFFRDSKIGLLWYYTVRHLIGRHLEEILLLKGMIVRVHFLQQNHRAKSIAKKVICEFVRRTQVGLQGLHNEHVDILNLKLLFSNIHA